LNQSIYDLIIIFLFWCFLPWALLWISGKVALVGIYHVVKNKDNPDGEEFFKKIGSVFACNISLSLPLIAALYTTITTTIDGIPLSHAAPLTLVISSAMLLVFRITANPSEHFAELLDIRKNEDVHRHKNNVLSLFYSFICAALMILLVIESYNIFANSEINLPGFEIKEFITILIMYTLLTAISTMIGEFVLRYICKPVIAEDYMTD
jgi:hypothetical protein